MNLIDQANIFRFHDQLIKEFGINSNAALGWNEPAGQEIRFKILSGIGPLHEHTVLDAGCGHGDLVTYLRKLSPLLYYFGVEQIPAILKVALERHGHLPDTCFFEGDFSAASLPPVDYTIACGSLNYHNSDDLFILKTIEKLYRNSRIAFGFNLLNKIEPANSFLQAYKPGYIKEFCSEIATHVTLIENYYAHDYTVFMYH